MLRLDLFKLRRTMAALDREGLTGALFTDYYNVSYLTGYTTFLENGPNPFTRGAAAALVLPGEVHLVAEGADGSVTVEEWGGVATSYPGYSAAGPITDGEAFIDATLAMLRARLPTRGRFGYEPHYLPAALYAALPAGADHSWRGLSPQLMLDVRAVKSAAELDKLRAAAHLADIGQEAVYAAVAEPGVSEIAVYNTAKRAMEEAIGRRFPLQDALHGGVNSALPVPGMPTDYVLQAGDLIISDMVPCLDGYWADSCSTFAVGRVVTEEARRIHAVARGAFERGLAAVRPGITGHDLAEIVLGEVRRHGYDYWHHTGHGVGVSNHEEPRITPGSRTMLAPDMVLLMEPGVYIEGFGGCRQERMIRVTEDGAELMTTNRLELI